ncbi:DUF2125 domain-containing protein [Pseudotabrizicola algicola]|uniref:DUF2125 domain-containing protein n=1 Tax=Pseudotabrizicola algicola TaxID=2709381 RepID=A0A6B3RTQ3_9RHOB|nr:DUF2125 domain-containing protein [Pseudotabrizicola algicola]NEX46419.1 DUF2125 domain-containing protein [Pseudotabrizicola algicola]
MSNSIGMMAPAILAACLAAPAMAQVTPEEVWQGWQKMGASYGQAIIADQVVRDGDTLVVSGMNLSMDQDGAQIEGSIDEVRFRDRGDGTVEITMTDSYAIDMALASDDGTSQSVTITMTQPGMTLIAGGSATQTSYDFDAPSVEMAMTVTEDAEPQADVQATLTGLSGKYLVDTQESSTVLDSTLAVEGLTFEVAAGDDTNGATVGGTLEALKMASSGTFLGVEAMDDVAQALRDGFSANTDFSFGKGNYSIDVLEAGAASKIVTSNETGHFRLAMNEGGLQYGAGGTGVAMTITGGDIPFPEVKLTYAEASFDFLMPLLASDTPTDFSFLTRIVDLTVSDEIWAMFDPTVALPRAPATLVLDTKGKVRLTSDLVDEEEMAALGEAAPGEIHALDLTDLTVKFAGAELNGTGAMTFDNSDTTSFDGIPAPTGKIDLVIRGGNALLDKLVTMGVIPQDQAMGTRMMIAMFAKPGEGTDVLNSSLEFRDKAFFANGQRLK